MRDVPADWRSQILDAATSATRATEPSEFSHALTGVATIKTRLAAIFWPHPIAWAGLAVIWLGILTFTFAGRDESQVLAKACPPPSPEVLTVLRSQERLLAELIGPLASQPSEVDRPKSIMPLPRSQWCGEMCAA